MLRNYLPRSLCEQPKSGFNVPLMRVLSTADRRLLAAVITSSTPLRELVKAQYIAEMANSFASRRWDTKKHSEFMIYQRFYALLALAIWLEECGAAT